MAKGVDTDDEEVVLKGKSGYTVVWEDNEEVGPKEEKAEGTEDENVSKPEANKETHKEVKPKTEEKKEQKKEEPKEELVDQEDPKPEKKHHPHHRHRSMAPYYILISLTLVWLLYVNFALFLIAAAVSALILYYAHQNPEVFEPKPEPAPMQLQILHPIKTGFEIALGMGLFALVCMLLGALMVGILIFGAAFGLWSGLSVYIHP
jgi:hypothetical protein